MMDDWRSSGHPLLGRRVARTYGDGLQSCGAVTFWLPPTAADPFVDAKGNAAPLFKITFTDGDLAGDSEDLELSELNESLVVVDVNDERDEEDEPPEDDERNEEDEPPEDAGDVDAANLDRLILEEYQPARGYRCRYPKARAYVQHCLKGSDKRQVSAIIKEALERARNKRRYELRKRKRAEAAVPAPAVASVSASFEAIRHGRAETGGATNRAKEQRVTSSDVAAPSPLVEESKLDDPSPGERIAAADENGLGTTDERDRVEGGVDESTTNASVGVVFENERAVDVDEPSATTAVVVVVVERHITDVVDEPLAATDGVVESDCAGGVAPTSPPLSTTHADVVVESDRADSVKDQPAFTDVVFVVESDRADASRSLLLSRRPDAESDDHNSRASPRPPLRLPPEAEEAAPQEGAQPPTVIAEEGTLSREVDGVLLKLGLASYRQHFINYGAATMDDLLFLTEDDCLDMEMNLFKRRRLLRFLDDERRHPSA